MFRRLSGKRGMGHANADAERSVALLEAENRRLVLELETLQRDRARLLQELSSRSDSGHRELEEAIQLSWERLFRALASSVASLHTQMHLQQDEGVPIEAADVLSVVRGQLLVLQDFGLRLEGEVGETVQYAPDRHEPLSAYARLAAGEPAVLRFVGVSFRGRILRKASVEAVDE